MNTYYMIYVAGLLLFGCAVVFSGIWIIKLNPDNLSIKEKLPRNVWLGMIFGVAGLIWCIPHSKPILPDSLHPYLIPAVIVCAFLAYNFLDYLFARAIGGFMILLAHYFLHESFTLHTPASPVFAAFCMAMGIVGIFFAGKPYLFRDFIRKAAGNHRLRIGSASVCWVFGIFCVILGVLQLTMKQG